jgi:hypothetical protein
MDILEKLDRLRERRDGLLKKLSAVKDFRPGSMGPRFRKCGKPYCHCARDGSKGHGPSWSLTRKVDGKTVTKIIPVAAVEQTQEQLDEFHRFTETVGKLVETSVLICDTLLELPQATEAAVPDAVAAEKKGSRRPSRRRS